MPNDALEASLIDGGLPAAAAKILSNAIGNVATGRTYFGRQTEDATPISSMRLIDADTRRYVLTNLDNPSEKALKDRIYSEASQYTRSGNAHPYEGSQPSTANPTLNTDAVTPGKFVTTSRKTTGEVAQAEVGLKIDERGGDHARLNKETGSIETVPISVEIEPQGILEAEVVEEEGRTVIKIRCVNDALLQFLEWKFGETTAIVNNTLYVENKNVPVRGAQVLVKNSFY